MLLRLVEVPIYIFIAPVCTSRKHGQYFLLFFFFSFQHFRFPVSGQAVVTQHRCRPFPPRFLPLLLITHRVQQSHCSSIIHRVLLTHALALSASQFVRKMRSLRIYTSVHSGGLELTKPTYTRLEDNLIRHRGDRHMVAGGATLQIATTGCSHLCQATSQAPSRTPGTTQPTLYRGI